MSVIRELATGLLLLPAAVIGVLWVGRAWQARDLWTRAILGSVVGFSTHLTALNALCYVLRPGPAGWALLACETGAIVAWATGRWFWRPAESPSPGGPDEKPLALTWRAAIVAVVALWCFQGLQQGPLDYPHNAPHTGVLARHGLPAPDPLNPTQILVYHYLPELLAASLGSMTGEPPWWPLHGWTAWMAVLLAGAAWEFLRAAASRQDGSPQAAGHGQGLLLFLLGGGMSWLTWTRGEPGGVDLADWHLAWDGPASLLRLTAIPTGWVWWLAVWIGVLRWPRSESRAAGSSPVLPFALLLGVMPLLAEHAAALIGVALFGLTLHRLFYGEEHSLCPADLRGWVVAGTAGLALGLVQGGVLTGQLLGLPGHETTRLAWSGSLWPSLPDTLTGSRQFAGGERFWQVLLRDFGAIPLLALAVGVWCLRSSRRAPLAARLAFFAALPGLLVGLYLQPALYVHDIFRFNQMFSGAVSLAGGLWLAVAWNASRTLMAKGVLLSLAVLLCLHGALFTVLNTFAIRPDLPYRYPEGLQRALQDVEKAGKGEEGILAVTWRGRDFPIPCAPGVLGRPVQFQGFGEGSWLHPGTVWRAAVECPSPANLGPAGLRWVCFGPDDLTRALPLLEERRFFEPVRDGDYLPYRLFHLRDDWGPELNGLALLRSMTRYRLAEVQAGPLRAAGTTAASLGDGDPRTGIVFPGQALRTEGLVVGLPITGTISMVWVLAEGFQLGSAEPRLFVAGEGESWRSPLGLRTFHSTGRPEAVTFRFPPCAVRSVRLLIEVPQTVDQVSISEVWVGSASDEPRKQH